MNKMDKYLGQPAPTISGQESIALEFNPPSGVVVIYYKLGKIDAIKEIAAGEIGRTFEQCRSGIRIYERFGMSNITYKLTHAK